MCLNILNLTYHKNIAFSRTLTLSANLGFLSFRVANCNEIYLDWPEQWCAFAESRLWLKLVWIGFPPHSSLQDPQLCPTSAGSNHERFLHSFATCHSFLLYWVLQTRGWTALTKASITNCVNSVHHPEIYSVSHNLVLYFWQLFCYENLAVYALRQIHTALS